MKIFLILAVTFISLPAFAEQVVQCKDIHSALTLKLRFTEGYVQVLGDETQDGKSNTGRLTNPRSELSVYRGLTLYSQAFGWQETYEGNGLKDGEARLLAGGDETMIIESTNDEGKLDRIVLSCDVI